MIKKIFVFALGAIFLTLSFASDAQQPTKIPRIGIVTAQPLAAVSARHEAFRRGLRELGYVEGKNIFIEIVYFGLEEEDG